MRFVLNNYRIILEVWLELCKG